jgi:hypothetical protein
MEKFCRSLNGHLPWSKLERHSATKASAPAEKRLVPNFNATHKWWFLVIWKTSCPKTAIVPAKLPMYLHGFWQQHMKTEYNLHEMGKTSWTVLVPDWLHLQNLNRLGIKSPRFTPIVFPPSSWALLCTCAALPCCPRKVLWPWSMDPFLMPASPDGSHNYYQKSRLPGQRSGVHWDSETNRLTGNMISWQDLFANNTANEACAQYQIS